MPKIIPEKLYLIEERNELVWFLLHRGLNGQEVGQIMNIDRSWVAKIADLKPKRWQPKYKKA